MLKNLCDNNIYNHRRNRLSALISDSVLHQAKSAAIPPPLYYSQNFHTRANELVRCALGIDLLNDINAGNCVVVYKYLINNVSE